MKRATIKEHSLPHSFIIKTSIYLPFHPWMEDLSSSERTAPPLCPGSEPSLPQCINLFVSCITSFFLTPESPSANKHTLVSPILKKENLPSPHTSSKPSLAPLQRETYQNSLHSLSSFSSTFSSTPSICLPRSPPPHSTPSKLPLSKLPVSSICQILSFNISLSLSTAFKTRFLLLASMTAY